jgi:putative ABC transport system permease protein
VSATGVNLIDAKLLWRDWRGGQLNLIVSALVLAVMVVTAVSVLADRVERGLTEQISSFLAADLALQGGIEIPDSYQVKAQQLQLRSANVAMFGSMVYAGDINHLASVKAVEASYPLRGVIEVSKIDQPQQVEKLEHGPPLGEVWVEPRLLNLLDLEIGQLIEVGYSKLKVTRVIVNEPDRGTGFSGAGARVMMSIKDLPESQLIRPGSRVTYRVLLAGAEKQIQVFHDWYQQGEQAIKGEDAVSHFRLITPQESEESLSEALDRGRAFLLLSGTIGVLLAGLAIALASHQYARRLTDQVALMKAWGQSAASIRRSHLIRLLIIAATSTAIGLTLGWLAHYLLLEAAKGLFDAQLPSAGWRPWFVAITTGFVCVVGFALPALWHLPTVAPLRVLRRDLPDTLVSKGRRLMIGISALLGLTYWYSGSITMTLMFLGALFGLFGICALVALQILKLVQRLGSWRGSYVRLGLANLWRRRAQTMIQLVAFSATLMLLLLVIGMRTNLISEWQAQLPANTPSHFLFNVANTEQSAVINLLAERKVKSNKWYPMVRGRLVGLNGSQISAEQLRQTDGLGREVNFTQTNELPYGNEIIEGQWFATPLGKDQSTDDSKRGIAFSMEAEVAQELGVEVGDVIEFSIGGIKIEAWLSSIRSVDWRTMTPNFYIIFEPGALDRFSPNWLTSLQAPQRDDATVSPIPEQAPFVAKLVREYPTAVVIELGDIINRIRNIIDRVTQGLEMILLLVLACGTMVLFAAVGVSFDERLRENAILRTLGSSRKIIVGALTVEYAVLGAIAGFIASVGAELILYFVQTTFFKLQPSFHFNLWLTGMLGGVGLITVLGLLRSREIITVPPLQSLQRIS